MKKWIIYPFLLLTFLVLSACSTPKWDVTVKAPATYNEGNPMPLQFTVKDKDGNPLSGALVEATLEMKQMDHGKVQISAEEIESGKYLALPKLPMDGDWVANVQVTYNNEKATFTENFTAKIRTVQNAHQSNRELTMPAFQLIDQNGNKVTDQDLRGKTVVMTFTYVFCNDPNACPVLLGNFKKLQSAYAEKGIDTKDIVLVSVSVDPEVDTPAAMLEHAERMKFDMSYLKMLTGSLADVRKFTDALGVQFKKENNEVLHDNKTFIFDKNGKLTHEFTVSNIDTNELVEVTTK